MSFSFCLNKNEMLTLCGLSLLYQRLDLKQEGKLMQDGQRLVVAVIKLLEKADAPGALDFKRLASSMITLDTQSKQVSGRSPMVALNSSKSTHSHSVTKQQIRPQMYRLGSASISESDLLAQQEKLRRATLPNIAMNRNDHLPHGRTSVDSTRSESPMSKREYRSSAPQSSNLKPLPPKADKPPNLDYLSLNNTPLPSQPQSPIQSRSHNVISTKAHTPIFPTPAYSNPKHSAVTPTEWEALLGSLDGGQTNLYDAIYGGPSLSLADTTPSNYGDWSPDSGWDMTALTMNDFTNTGPARSVLSFSEESLSSGEDLATSDLGLGGRQDFRNTLMAGAVSSHDGYLLDGLDGTFGL
jgi:hypothetical protein